MSITDRLLEIEAAIRAHAGDRPVTLVAVTKYAALEQMREAYQAGIRHFGENKVQDALAKMTHFPEEQFPGLHWHFIGNLQSNKIRKTVGRFALLHGIDSLEHAELLSQANLSAGLRQPILLQINTTDDPGRHGVLPDQITVIAKAIQELPGIELRGLMAMAPPETSLIGDTTALKGVFSHVFAMRKALQRDLGIDLPDLSMGMSHDYVHALACGATIIRIGNYLFKNEQVAYNKKL